MMNEEDTEGLKFDPKPGRITVESWWFETIATMAEIALSALEARRARGESLPVNVSEGDVRDYETLKKFFGKADEGASERLQRGN